VSFEFIKTKSKHKMCLILQFVSATNQWLEVQCKNASRIGKDDHKVPHPNLMRFDDSCEGPFESISQPSPHTHLHLVHEQRRK